MSEMRYPCGVEGCTDPECTLDPPERTMTRMREGIISDTEYTPTDDDVRGWAVNNFTFMKEDWDRWLAAHDAELTERVRAEQIETDAQIAEESTRPRPGHGSMNEGSRSAWYAHGRQDAATAIREGNHCDAG